MTQTAPSASQSSVTTKGQVPALSPRWGVVAALTTTVLLGLAETDRLSSQIVAPLDQRPHSFDSVTGVAVLVGFNPVDTAADWAAGLGADPAWLLWLGIHTGLDLVLVVLWGLVWWREYGRGTDAPLREALRSLRLPRATWRRVVLLGVIGVALDLLEDLLVLGQVGARAVAGPPAEPPLAWGTVTAVVTLAKWLALLGFVGAGAMWLVKDSESEAARTTLRRGWRALVHQRLSLLVLAPLAGLALVPRGDISDQVPDVQRAWADSLTGLGEAVLAGVVLLAVSLGLFVLGRLRSDHVYRLVAEFGRRTPHQPGAVPPPLGRVLSWVRARTRGADEPAPAGAVVGLPGAVSRPRASLWLWLVWPGVLVLLGAGLAVTGHGAVIWWRLLLFCLPAVLIGTVSAGLRLGRYRDPALAPVPRVPDAAQYRLSAATGDALAVCLLAVGGLGLVRSFTAPLVLGLAALRAPGGLPNGPAEIAVPLAAVSLGILGALLPWWVVPRLLDSMNRSTSTGIVRRLLTPGADVPAGEGFRLAFVGVTVALLVAAASFPALAEVGVVAMALLALTALALAVGAVQVIGQDRHPPEIFWLPWLRRPAAPVVGLTSLALVFAVTLGAGGPATAAHRVEEPVSPGIPGRPDLAAALDLWLAARPGCGREAPEVGGAVRVRPLVFVAAEGGGIRATYWTTSTLSRLQSAASGQEPCRDAFLSTGASGGAVGLTLARFTPRGSAAAFAEKVSTSVALSGATQGLLVRDTFFAATGVGPQAAPGWTDRAATIENAWVRDTTTGDTSSLAAAFLPTAPTAPDSPTGYLMLGATSVGTGCRVLLSQIALPAPSDPLGSGHDGAGRTQPVPCDGTDAPASRSFDLFAAYGQGPDATCTGNLRAATVALLASRFPYVTPSGIVGPCRTWRDDQIVDGGYEENTGLGIIVDLAPRWLAVVRSHNDKVLADRTGTLVVPMVVFLTNGTGADLLPSDRAVTQELFVPPVAYLRGGKSQNSASALLQRAAALTAQQPWSVSDVSLPSEVAAAVAAVRTFVVFPATRPSVTAPLGWTLSRSSRLALDARAEEQLAKRCPAPASSASPSPVSKEAAVVDILCVRGYGTLGDAAALLSTLS